LFLVLGKVLQSIGDALNCILSWLENHSGIIGIVTVIIAGSFWFNKFLRQKRAEAFFGFYAQLLLQIKSLKSLLKDNELLEIKKINYGNIYSLLYTNDSQKSVCGGFKRPSAELLNDIEKLTLQLKNTLINSENNVYPKTSEKAKWYDSQHTLFEFCEFLERKSLIGKMALDIANYENKDYEHTTKCQELVKALEHIEESIEKEIIDNKY